MSEYEHLKAQKDAMVARQKKEVAVAIGLKIYADMMGLAMCGNQVVGEKNNFYVTLEQLEKAFIELRDSY